MGPSVASRKDRGTEEAVDSFPWMDAILRQDGSSCWMREEEGGMMVGKFLEEQATLRRRGVGHSGSGASRLSRQWRADQEPADDDEDMPRFARRRLFEAEGHEGMKGRGRGRGGGYEQDWWSRPCRESRNPSGLADILRLCLILMVAATAAAAAAASSTPSLTPTTANSEIIAGEWEGLPPWQQAARRDALCGSTSSFEVISHVPGQCGEAFVPAAGTSTLAVFSNASCPAPCGAANSSSEEDCSYIIVPLRGNESMFSALPSVNFSTGVLTAVVDGPPPMRRRVETTVWNVSLTQRGESSPGPTSRLLPIHVFPPQCSDGQDQGCSFGGVFADGDCGRELRYEYPVRVRVTDIPLGGKAALTEIQVFDSDGGQVIPIRVFGPEADASMSLEEYNDGIETTLLPVYLPWGTYTFAVRPPFDDAPLTVETVHVPRWGGDVVAPAVPIARRLSAAAGSGGEAASHGENGKKKKMTKTTMRTPTAFGATAFGGSNASSVMLGWGKGGDGQGSMSSIRRIGYEGGCDGDCTCDELCCNMPQTCRGGQGCEISESVGQYPFTFTCASSGVNIVDIDCQLVVGTATVCAGLTCAAAVCNGQGERCSAFTPEYCTTCDECAYQGLGIWCTETSSCHSRSAATCTDFVGDGVGTCGTCGACGGSESAPPLPREICVRVETTQGSPDHSYFGRQGMLLKAAPPSPAFELETVVQCARNCTGTASCTGFEFGGGKCRHVPEELAGGDQCFAGGYQCRSQDDRGSTVYLLNESRVEDCDPLVEVEEPQVCPIKRDECDFAIILTNRTGASTCSQLSANLWCDQDCVNMMAVLETATSPTSLSSSQVSAVCSSPCFFGAYKAYIEQRDLTGCAAEDGFVYAADPRTEQWRYLSVLCSLAPDGSRCANKVRDAAISSNFLGHCPQLAVSPSALDGFVCSPACNTALGSFVASSGCCLGNLYTADHLRLGAPNFYNDFAAKCSYHPGRNLSDTCPSTSALSGVCGIGGSCAAGGGGCQCRSGYRLADGKCQDVDECSGSSPKECPSNSACLNTDGGAICRCLDGYVGDAEEASDVNPDPCQPITCGNFDSPLGCTPDGAGACDGETPGLAALGDVRFGAAFQVGCKETYEARVVQELSSDNDCFEIQDSSYLCELGPPQGVPEGGVCHFRGLPSEAYCTSNSKCARARHGGPCVQSAEGLLVPETAGVGIYPTFTCMAHGSFDAQLECTKVICDAISVPPNATVEPDSGVQLIYPEVGSITCDPGFVLDVFPPTQETFRAVACQAGGTLSTVPKCKARECGVYEPSTEYGADCASDEKETCEATCCNCISLAPLCSVNSEEECPIPGGTCGYCSYCIKYAASCGGFCSEYNQNNSAAAGITPVIAPSDSVSYPNKVDLSCPPGFSLANVLSEEAGVSSPSCQESGSFQAGKMCVAITCPAPTVAFGKAGTGRPGVFGERIDVECSFGFLQGSNGTATPMCLETGEYEDYPKCFPVPCGKFEAPPLITSDAVGRDFTFLDYPFEVFCPENYSPAKQVVSCTAQGNFSAILPCVSIICEELIVDNAQVLCMQPDPIECPADHIYRFPFKYKIVCDTGYEPEASLSGEVSDIAQCTEQGDYSRYSLCQDQDECDKQIDNCDPISTSCVNTEGSFECTCKLGFLPFGEATGSDAEPNPTACEDVDECGLLLANCHPTLAQCFNSPGSFECSCNPGFGGDKGLECSPIALQILASPEARDSLAGFALLVQPVVQIVDQLNFPVSSPRSLESTQLIKSRLLGPREGGGLQEVSSQLIGRSSEPAPTGVSSFTNLAVGQVGSEWVLEFYMDPIFKVQSVQTGQFAVIPGPASRIRITQQPPATAVNQREMPGKMSVIQSDRFGNDRTDAENVDVGVFLSKDESHEGPEGYLAGRIDGATTVRTTGGAAEFSQLRLFGLGRWRIAFTAVIALEQVVEYSNVVTMEQIDTEPLQFTINADISSFGAQAQTTFLKAISRLIGLPVEAMALENIRAGSVIADVRIYMLNSSSYYKAIETDMFQESGILSQAGAMSVNAASGLNAAAPQVLAAAAALDTRSLAEKLSPQIGMASQVLVAGSAAVGVASLLLTEVIYALSPGLHQALRGGIGGDWGGGARPGGALLAVMGHAQFVALSGEMSGQIMERPHLMVQDGNVTYLDPAFVPMPRGVSTVAHYLTWTNFRTNLTAITLKPDLLPRTCDSLASDFFVGTMFTIFFFCFAVGLIRFVFFFLLKSYTLRTRGDPYNPQTMRFPRWEKHALDVAFLGICQACGVAIGSNALGCWTWVGVGIAFAVILPGLLLAVYTGLVYRLVSKDSYIVWKPYNNKSDSDTAGRGRHAGKWKDGTHGRVKALKVRMLVDRFTGPATYFFVFLMIRRISVGIASTAGVSSRVSVSIFVAACSGELIGLVALRPFRDRWMNVIEGILAAVRMTVSCVGLAYVQGLIVEQDATQVIVWVNLMGSTLATLNHLIEVLLLFFSVFMARRVLAKMGVLVAKPKVDEEYWSEVVVYKPMHEGDGGGFGKLPSAEKGTFDRTLSAGKMFLLGNGGISRSGSSELLADSAIMRSPSSGERSDRGKSSSTMELQLQERKGVFAPGGILASVASKENLQVVSYSGFEGLPPIEVESTATMPMIRITIMSCSKMDSSLVSSTADMMRASVLSAEFRMGQPPKAFHHTFTGGTEYHVEGKLLYKTKEVKRVHRSRDGSTCVWDETFSFPMQDIDSNLVVTMSERIKGGFHQKKTIGFLTLSMKQLLDAADLESEKRKKKMHDDEEADVGKWFRIQSHQGHKLRVHKGSVKLMIESGKPKCWPHMGPQEVYVARMKTLENSYMDQVDLEDFLPTSTYEEIREKVGMSRVPLDKQDRLLFDVGAKERLFHLRRGSIAEKKDEEDEKGALELVEGGGDPVIQASIVLKKGEDNLHPMEPQPLLFDEEERNMLMDAMDPSEGKDSRSIRKQYLDSLDGAARVAALDAALERDRREAKASGGVNGEALKTVEEADVDDVVVRGVVEASEAELTPVGVDDGGGDIGGGRSKPTAGRPRTLGVGAGTMRREVMSQRVTSSIRFAPHAAGQGEGEEATAATGAASESTPDAPRHKMPAWKKKLVVQMEKGDLQSPRKNASASTPRAEAELSARGTTPRSTLEFMRKFKESQEGAAAARRASASVGLGSTPGATTARSGNGTVRSGNNTGRSGGQTNRTAGTESSGERTYRAKRNSSLEAMSSSQEVANWKANF